MKFFVTGAAGFIGSTFTDRVLSAGHSVVGYDDYSTGFESFIKRAQHSANFKFVQGDVLNLNAMTEAMCGAEIVVHFAANADVRFGTHHPSRDLEQNTIATFRVLEAMRANSIKRIAFSSTGSVYGESVVIPTPEDAPFPVQTSLYGASKVACEGLISAYAEGFDFVAIVFRFVSILGPRYTHGHVFDFYKQLRRDPTKLRILGDGNQRKSYLHVDDCIDAMLTAITHAEGKFNVFNLGTDENCQVNDSIRWICDELGLEVERIYSGGDRGWIGDNPYIFLDCQRIRSLGWQPRHNIEEGVRLTLRWLRDNAWVMDART
jgi:UDP-glucose 4-epimerase